MHSRTLLVHFGVFGLAVLVFAGVTFAQAPVLSYRLLVDGAEVVDPVPEGMHALDVQVQVTENSLDALGVSGNGGVLQFAFSVLADPILSFEDLTGGFLGAADGKWDSMVSDAAAFSTAFSGELDINVGGTDYALFAETGATAPAAINTYFMSFGSTDWSTVVSGNFAVANGMGTLELVPDRTGSLVAIPVTDPSPGVQAAQPTTANGTSIALGGGVGGETPVIGGPDSVNLGMNILEGSLAQHQFDATGDPAPTWSLALDNGPGGTTDAGMIDSSGLFEWDTTGFPLGTYEWTVTASNTAGMDTVAMSARLIPEPASALLMGLAMIGLGFIRRK